MTVRSPAAHSMRANSSPLLVCPYIRTAVLFSSIKNKRRPTNELYSFGPLRSCDKAAFALLFAFFAFFSWTPAGASARYSPSSSNQAGGGNLESSYCPVFEEKCRCSVDLLEFMCRAAGFRTLPQDLPHSITKL